MAGSIALYLPHPFILHQEKLTRKEFVERYPQFRWIEEDLILEFSIFLTLMLSFAGGIFLLRTPLSFGLFSIIFAGLALYNGLLTAKTGICRVPYPRMPYRYLYDDKLRRVGWGQAILGGVIIVIAIGLALYKGPL